MKNYSIWLILILFIGSCGTTESEINLTLETAEPVIRTYRWVDLEMEITNPDEVDILEQGFVIGTSAHPTITSNLQKYVAEGTTYRLQNIESEIPYFVRSYARISGKTVYGNEVTFTIDQYELGAPGPAGGMIFYKTKAADGVDFDYLEAAPDGWHTTAGVPNSAKWGCETITIGTSVEIGNGKSNTDAIVAGCAETGIAARIASDLVFGGKDDWFLPSFSEMSLLFTFLRTYSDQEFAVSEENGLTSTETNPEPITVSGPKDNRFMTFIPAFHRKDGDIVFRPVRVVTLD